MNRNPQTNKNSLYKIVFFAFQTFLAHNNDVIIYLRFILLVSGNLILVKNNISPLPQPFPFLPDNDNIRMYLICQLSSSTCTGIFVK
jgi:hypothetical protein